MLGQVTVPVKRYSESVTQGKRTVSVSLHEEKRALLDDQECRSIPGLKKDRDGDVTENPLAAGIKVWQEFFMALLATNLTLKAINRAVFLRMRRI